MATMEIDETDKKIINALLEDSRRSYREIAKIVHVSVATIMHRINRLHKEKVIKNFTATINYDNLGYEFHVIVDIRVAKGKLFQVENKIATESAVCAVYDLTGAFDATIIARFKTRKAMDSFIKKIQTYDFVERTETKLVLNTIKEKGVSL
jgi:Lrp/AsnC family transcriptional regulator, regulator for asnA, asnC and gidA